MKKDDDYYSDKYFAQLEEDISPSKKDMASSKEDVAVMMKKSLESIQQPATIHPLFDVAKVLANQTEYLFSREFIKQWILLIEKSFGSDHPQVANRMTKLAWACLENGDHESAEQLFRRELAIKENVHGPEHPNVASTLYGLANTLHGNGDYDGAEQLFRRALANCQIGPWC